MTWVEAEELMSEQEELAMVSDTAPRKGVGRPRCFPNGCPKIETWKDTTGDQHSSGVVDSIPGKTRELNKPTNERPTKQSTRTQTTN